MNEAHRTLCSSSEWADALRQYILPWTLEDLDLGGEVVELGPGPGLSTELLAERASRVTAVELDAELAAAASERLGARSSVRVIQGDATATGLPSESADAVVCFTMLHHVPTPALQDAIFAEAHRLLRPGGVFAGSDSVDDPEFRALHEGDICVPVPPETLERRLLDAGFSGVAVETNPWAVRFRGTR
jgi:SAM-dependent methyltransferase